MADVPKVRVPRAKIQSIFNEHYLPLVMNGQLREVPIDIRIVGTVEATADFPDGTRHITAWYWDDARGMRVALAHHAWLPARPGLKWRIGASGVPDGKTVYWDGQLLIPANDAAGD